MAQQRTRCTRWLFWFGWQPEKLAAWLEKQAADGWQLIKADVLLHRFYFRRSDPERLRFFVDYVGHMPTEHRRSMHGAGWMLHTLEAGWCIWQTSFNSDPPPAVHMNVHYLVETNRRLLLAYLAPLFSILAYIPLQMHVWPTLWSVWPGKLFIGTVAICIVVLASAVVWTLGKIRQLHKRNPFR